MEVLATWRDGLGRIRGCLHLPLVGDLEDAGRRIGSRLLDGAESRRGIRQIGEIVRGHQRRACRHRRVAGDREIAAERHRSVGIARDEVERAAGGEVGGGLELEIVAGVGILGPEAGRLLEARHQAAGTLAGEGQVDVGVIARGIDARGAAGGGVGHVDLIDRARRLLEPDLLVAGIVRDAGGVVEADVVAVGVEIAPELGGSRRRRARRWAPSS